MATICCLALTLIHGQLEAVQRRLKELGKVEFAYEGEYERLIEYAPGLGDPRQYSFSGKVKIDAARPIVIQEHYEPYGETLSTSKMSVTPKYHSYVSLVSDKKDPINQTKSSGGFYATTHGALPFANWFPTLSLLIANEEDAKAFEVLREETRHGRRCLVLRMRFMDIQETDYWIDLERHGLVLDSEARQKGVQMGRLRYPHIAAIRSTSGRTVWLPTTIISESIVTLNSKTNKWEQSDKPTVRETIRIVASTIKVDDKSGAKVEELRFNQKAPVRDETIASVVEQPVSANAPPKPVQKAVTAKEVMQTVTDADVQKAELQATLRPPPVDWTGRIAWGLVVLGAVGVGFTFYRRYHGE